MKVSQIQDHLAAAGYLNLDIVKAREDGVWGPYTAAAYEQAVREILPSLMTHNNLEYVATHQPEGDLDINLVTGLEAKAEERGEAFRKQTKARTKSDEQKKKTRAKKAKAKKASKVSPQPANKPQPKSESEKPKPSIVTDKRIM